MDKDDLALVSGLGLHIKNTDLHGPFNRKVGRQGRQGGSGVARDNEGSGANNLQAKALSEGTDGAEGKARHQRSELALGDQSRDAIIPNQFKGMGGGEQKVLLFGMGSGFLSSGEPHRVCVGDTSPLDVGSHVHEKAVR